MDTPIVKRIAHNSNQELRTKNQKLFCRRQLGIGVVGLGRWGRNYLTALSLLSKKYHLSVFISEPNLPKYLSFDEILANLDIKGVIIATPEETHSVLTMKALLAGKDVLVEKPMVLHPKEGETIVKVAQEKGLVLAVGHTPIYSEGFEKMKRELLNGAVGKIVRVKAIRTSQGRPGSKVSVLWDLAPHCLAMAIHLWGEPVSGQVLEFDRHYWCYELSFLDGFVFQGNVAWGPSPYQREFQVIGTNKSVKMEENHASGVLASPLVRQCEDFIQCCLTRRQPLSDGVLGFKVVKTLWKLQKGVE